METESTTKNFIQRGKATGVANTDNVEILSGPPMMVGKIVTIATTNITAGRTGNGFTGGVFLPPKLTTDAIIIDEQVHIKDGKVRNDTIGIDLVGTAWEDATANSTTVAMKVNA